MKWHHLRAATALPFLACAAAAQSYSNPYTITTPAGNTNGPGFANGTGSQASFNRPGGVVFGSDGAIYVADTFNYAIRRVVVSSGQTTTFAGSGTLGQQNGQGTAAQFGPVYGIGVDGQGDLYVSDWVNTTGSSGALRKIDTSGNVTTLVASGLDEPQGLAVDGSGNVYVACVGDSTIRKVTSSGQVSLFAGTAGQAGLAPGGPGTGQLGAPTGVVLDGSGNLYVADVSNSVIVKINPAGSISIYSGSTNGQGILDGSLSAAKYSHPAGITMDGSGNLYIVDDQTVVREISASGNVSTVAGLPGVPGTLDGSGGNARFNFRLAVGGIAATPAGNLAIADTTNATIRYGIPVPAGPPTIQYQPDGETVNIGGTALLSVTANGPNPSYQWMFNDGFTNSAISGATSSTLSLSNIGANQEGAYTVVVSDSSGSITSQAATVTVLTQSHLINLSARANVGVGANVLDAGFVLSGTGTKPVLIRGAGPALAQFGVTGFLANPVLTLYNNQQQSIAQNIGWNNDPTLQTAFTNTGAFNFPANSADSALLQTLQPNPYTATVAGQNSTTGNALVEIYDDQVSNTACNLINLSARAVATPSAPLTAGFVIGGTSPMTVLIRGIGPTLASYGVTGALPNTQLTLYNVGQSIITSNTGWGGATALSDMFQKVYAFSLSPGSLDSALVVTLAPGNYTATVSPSDGTSSGVALVEVYEIQ